MLEFYRDRFVQLLHDAPAKEPVLSEPKYSPYLQSVMDTAKKEGVLNLAMTMKEYAQATTSYRDTKSFQQ